MDRHDDEPAHQQSSSISSSHLVRCSGCGLPPQDGAALKRCRRCRQALYHNVTCQRQHYPHHKAQCRRASHGIRQSHYLLNSSASAAASNNDERSSISISNSIIMVRVEERPHRGKCLIAARDIGAHEVILPPRSSSMPTNAPTFAPMVPPVLFADQRQTHCAVCFQTLTTTTTHSSRNKTIVLCQEPRYYVAVCSDQCQTASQDWLPVETQAIASSLQHQFVQRPSVRILPSAVLIYRVLLAVVAAGSNDRNHDPNQSPLLLPYYWTCRLHWHNDVLAMKSHAPTDPAASTHAQAAFLLVSTWLRETSVTLLPRVVQMCGGDLETIVSQVLHRLLCNAFTVTSSSTSSSSVAGADQDDTTTSLGFGLYRSPAHCINHSCCPNAVQRFVLGTAGQCPGLQLQAGVRPIGAQEEICISYIATTSSSRTEQRRAELQSTYHFTCQCPRCGPIEYYL